MTVATVQDSVTATLHGPAGGNAIADCPASIGGVFHAQCRDAEGKLEWECDAHNTLALNGTDFLRNKLFTLSASGPTTLAAAPYIGLLTATPTTATLLSTMTEATGGAYARKLPTWASTETPSGANNTASAASWTASGTAITAVTYLFLSDTLAAVTGTSFIAFALLTGGPYTVNVGSTLSVTYTWSVS